MAFFYKTLNIRSFLHVRVDGQGAPTKVFDLFSHGIEFSGFGYPVADNHVHTGFCKD